jgi:hypothetical protein
MSFKRGCQSGPAAAANRFAQLRRPLGPRETVPVTSNLLDQILALREAAKRRPPRRREDGSRDRIEDVDPDLLD